MQPGDWGELLGDPRADSGDATAPCSVDDARTTSGSADDGTTTRDGRPVDGLPPEREDRAPAAGERDDGDAVGDDGDADGGDADPDGGDVDPDGDDRDDRDPPGAAATYSGP